MDATLALIAAVFVASLAGSVHCAGMCGPFLAIGVGASAERRVATQAAYHLGRLTTYVLVGFAAGAIGATLDAGGAMLLGLQRVALLAAAATLILFGSVALARLHGVHVGRLSGPSRFTRFLGALHRLAARLPPVRRALAVGLFSTLLPCGWLWAFAATAAGTGAAPEGALTMAAFWGGTLPMMVGLGAGLQLAALPLRRHAPSIGAVLLIVVGLFALAGRAGVLTPPQGEADAASPPSCHDESTVPVASAERSP